MPHATAFLALLVAAALCGCAGRPSAPPASLVAAQPAQTAADGRDGAGDQATPVRPGTAMLPQPY